MKRIIISLLPVFFVVAFASGQESQNTKNSADQTLRSNGTVNPSTLGLEISIPLGNYPGRGTGLPLGLSYSSKLWRFEPKRVWVTPHYTNGGSGGGGGGNVGGNEGGDISTQGDTYTYVAAEYSENAAAGWTSSIAQPYIEYSGEFTYFNSFGNPVTDYDWSPRADPGGRFYVRRITVNLPNGVSYELRAGDAPIDMQDAVPSDGTYLSVDGSGVRYEEHQATGKYRLNMPDGSFYDFGPAREDRFVYNEAHPQIRRATRLSDPHGNFITFNDPDPVQGNIAQQYPYGSITDQLGRTFPVMVPRDNPDQPVERSFFLPGMTAPYTLKWQRLHDSFTTGKGYEVKYRGTADYWEQYYPGFGPALFDLVTGASPYMSECTSDRLFVLANGDQDPNPQTEHADLFDPVVLTAITLPNGSKYKFTYDPYGEVEHIHYPTGGREELTYAQVASLAQMSAPYQLANRGVTTRNIYESSADTTADSWTYSAQSSPSNYWTTITAPDLTKTVSIMHRGVHPESPPYYYCQSHGIEEFPSNDYGLRWGYDSALAGKAYDERVFAQNGKLIRRTLTKWVPSENEDGQNVRITLTPARYPQYNARAELTASITYNDDGVSGVAAYTKQVYSNTEHKGSPLNIVEKREYAYAIVSDGGISASATPGATPGSVADPTGNWTPSRITETDYKTDAAYVEHGFLKLPVEVRVEDGSNNIKTRSRIVYDEAASPNYLVADSVSGTVPGWSDLNSSVRGLPTTMKTWYNLANNEFIATHVQYNQFGSPRKSWDGSGNMSEIAYDDNYSDTTDRHSYAFPTTTISAVPNTSAAQGSATAFQTHTEYRFETGQPISNTDINGQTTSFEYNDPLLRPTKVTAPNGQQTVTEYGEPSSGEYAAAQRFVKVSAQLDASTSKQNYQRYDGLGRTVQTQSVDHANNGDIFVDTEYDEMGRASSVSNPYRNVAGPHCGTTIDCTTSEYDTAGRLWRVTAPDSAPVETTYGVVTTGAQIGTVVTRTDEAGKQRRTVSDAFGQPTRVDEPDLDNYLGLVDSPNQATYYSYSTAGKLIRVLQGVQNRYFKYDDVGRMLRFRQPEQEVNTDLNTTGNPDNNSWTAGFTYDSNGNALTTTNANGVTITNTFDGLNRATTRSYSDGTPTVTNYYDGNGLGAIPGNSKGKLTRTASTVSESRYTAFDECGRMTQSQQITDGQTYASSYIFNLAGILIQEAYPSGRVVRNQLDANGDLARISGKPSSGGIYQTFATGFSYFPDGKVEKIQLGNGLIESAKLNSRLQLEQLTLGHSVDEGSLLKLHYDYGELQSDGATVDLTKNAGNIAKQTVSFSGLSNPLVQVYKYDSLDRITEARETVNGTQTWKQTYGNDVYGNRNAFYQIVGSQTLTINNLTLPTVVANSNRFANGQGYSFDKNGNVTADPVAGGRTFVFNGDNKQTEVKNSSNYTIGRYFYDAEGRRVKKVTDTETTVFVYDGLGKLLAEYSTAPPSQAPTINYTATDKVGSPRVLTNSLAQVASRRDFMPFGEELYADGTYRKTGNA